MITGIGTPTSHSNNPFMRTPFVYLMVVSQGHTHGLRFGSQG